MKRQLDDYYDKFYTNQATRFEALSKNDNALAKEIASWKETVAERWDSINVVSKDTSALIDSETGNAYKLTYVIDEQGLNDAVGLELVSIKNDAEDEITIHTVRPFEMVKKEGNLYTFECKFEPDHAGTYKACVRMYPKCDKLPHRQDFSYVKWLD